MAKQKEISLKTKSAFMEAFCTLYTKKSLEQISIQEIARKAGYNRCTFYQYFLDIDDVLSCVEEELLECIAQKKQEEEPYNFLHSIIACYQEKGLYIDALLGDYGANHFMKILKERININTMEEQIADTEPLKPYLIEFRIDTSISLFRLWMKRNKDLPIEGLIKLITDLYSNGISSVL